MTIEAATNCWTEVEDAAYAALPELAAFRSLTGSADATAAAEFVFVDEVVDPQTGEEYSIEELQELRHYAVVSSANNEPFQMVRSGVVGELFDNSGALMIYLERLITSVEEAAEESEQLSEEASDRWFKNRVGDMMRELIAYWDQNNGPYVTSITVIDGPWHTNEDERENSGHWQGVEIALRWGRRSN